jgi:hypothetical protein
MNVWFDENGWLIRDIPVDALSDCSHQGSCDTDVKDWREQLDFNVPRNIAINWLGEFGIEDVDKMDDVTLADYVLWLFAGDYQDTNEMPIGLIH